MRSKADRFSIGGTFTTLPRYVDPIVLGSETYARNSRGLHVPATVLTIAERRAAPYWRRAVEDLTAADQEIEAAALEGPEEQRNAALRLRYKP